MPPTGLTDDVVEAIVRGDPVGTDAGPKAVAVAAFARRVQALGDARPPVPSADLAAVLGGGLLAPPGRVSTNGSTSWLRGQAVKVVGLGVAAKVALGASVAAAGVVGAGAAGILPGPASDAIRDAIETVTPIDFAEPGGGDAGRAGDGRDSRDAGDGGAEPRGQPAASTTITTALPPDGATTTTDLGSDVPTTSAGGTGEAVRPAPDDEPRGSDPSDTEPPPVTRPSTPPRSPTDPPRSPPRGGPPSTDPPQPPPTVPSGPPTTVVPDPGPPTPPTTSPEIPPLVPPPVPGPCGTCTPLPECPHRT